MEAATVHTQKPEKFLVRNNTAGYIGVIEIEPRTGEEKGVNIEPNGARWMTEEEMTATARAPRDPADNPFEAQTYFRQDPESQRQEEFRMRPLTLETDGTRFVPSSDRYVPTQDAPSDASPGVRHEAAVATAPVPAPPSTGSQAGSPPPPTAPVAAQDAPAPALRTQSAPQATPESQAGLSGGQATPPADEEGESWVEPPERPGEVVSGSLSGDDALAEEQEADATDHPGGPPPVAGQAQAAPQTPGVVEEELAQEVDPEVGEETGQARQPSQPQPEGEYASREEVGSPDAPERNDQTPDGG